MCPPCPGALSHCPHVAFKLVKRKSISNSRFDNCCKRKSAVYFKIITYQIEDLATAQQKILSRPYKQCPSPLTLWQWLTSATWARCLMPTWSLMRQGISTYNNRNRLLNWLKEWGRCILPHKKKSYSRVTSALWQCYPVPWFILSFCFQLSGCHQRPRDGTC